MALSLLQHQANNRQHFIDCWNDHLAQLYSVYSDADQLDEWETLRDQVQLTINKAARDQFPVDAELPAFLRTQAS